MTGTCKLAAVLAADVAGYSRDRADQDRYCVPGTPVPGTPNSFRNVPEKPGS
jgi:hypothetical protein